MKRILSVLLTALVLILLCMFSAAADDIDYQTLVMYYERAVEAESTISGEYALGIYRNLADYYNAMEEKARNELNARDYFRYAQGRILFSQEDYPGAMDYFEPLARKGYTDEEWKDLGFYHAFCEAVFWLNEGRIENALPLFAEAGEKKPDAEALCSKKINACETVLAERIQQACEKAEFEKALGYCDLIDQYISKKAANEWRTAVAKKRESNKSSELPISDSENGLQGVYNSGMQYLQEADKNETAGRYHQAAEQVEQALTLFRVLANSKFEDSENLVIYCRARVYELQGMRQKALDLYETLPNIYDSSRRYLNLSGKSREPTAKPEDLLLIPAKAYKETDLYAGPGFSYLQEDMKVSEKDELWIAGQYEDWYLLEFASGDMRARAWAQKFRIGRDEETEPPVFEKTEGKIAQEVIPAYGPGVDYRQREETLTSGTAVLKMAEDHGYTLVEYEMAGQGFVTGWVQTEFIQ